MTGYADEALALAAVAPVAAVAARIPRFGDWALLAFLTLSLVNLTPCFLYSLSVHENRTLKYVPQWLLNCELLVNASMEDDEDYDHAKKRCYESVSQKLRMPSVINVPSDLYADFYKDTRELAVDMLMLPFR